MGLGPLLGLSGEERAELQWSVLLAQQELSWLERESGAWLRLRASAARVAACVADERGAVALLQVQDLRAHFTQVWDRPPNSSC